MPRIAVVRKERCNPVGCGNYLCIRVCPVNREGKDCITKDPVTKVRVDPHLCVGCQICVIKCPFDVFYITNLPEDLCKTPIHQYGINGFKLYSLPTPAFGKVTGILGQNGIGKSTAIKILAGLLRPNLGTDKEAAFEEVIKFFKGSEAQRFFEQIKAGNVKVSYKPQQVDLIAKTAKGKVRDLLAKVDEQKKLQEIAELLDLRGILDNEVSTLSGGELQRVAIAACVLKKANLYIFDEPTSYLDIKQRLKVANFLRTLATPDTAVLVVEHDLIMLDAMTDLIHIMYGKEGAYGIVSQPKATRMGINAYLTGNMKDENMRFREHAIEFFARPPGKENREAIVTSWKGVRKTLDKFRLEAKEGLVRKHEVVGILGENGIGKTTFVKMLAHVHKPDAGEIDEKIRVAYKPQYLDSESTELVMTALGDALKQYEMQLIRPLDLKPLLTKQLNQLSGGELQRVAIAATLAKDADLYLLDEPSAYLDVEQRMIVSKAIKELTELRGNPVLVVDHDLLFMDYLSDRLIVFTGTPALHGSAQGPFTMEHGMNEFLQGIGLTFRRDEESHRPRLNKQGSVADREQKAENKYYYA
jgi:ATP-binding cassette subfamily E protein 1